MIWILKKDLRKMFDLIFYNKITLIRNFRKINEEHKRIMYNRVSFTNKEKNEMDLYLDNIARRFHYYMDIQDLRSYIIPYREYFNINIPIYIEKANM